VPKKLPHNKKLQKECEQLWKDIVGLRDGLTCLVRDKFPGITINHTLPFQADHCFTRSNKHLFLDPANGNMVCSSCNMAKHYDNKSVKRAVDYITQQRVGKKKWREMLTNDMQMGPNVHWNKIWWLEEKREELSRAHKKLQRQSDRAVVTNKYESKFREQRQENMPVGWLFEETEPV
jgi:hypothetical protein